MKRWMVAVAVVVVTTGLIGCIPEKRVFWSADGRWAAVRAGDGLYLCDEHGKLSERLLTDVGSVAWFADSKRLILARNVKAKTWDEVVQAVDSEVVRELEARGDRLHAEVLAYEGDLDDFEPQSTEGLTDTAKVALMLYVRDKRSAGMPEKLGKHWEGIEKAEAWLGVLQLAEAREAALELGPILVTSVNGIGEPGISPDGRKVAYLEAAGGEQESRRLHVVAVDASNPPALVAERTSMFTDWSADGRYLAYAAANALSVGSDGAMRLGVIARRQVCDGQGGLLETLPEAEDLAGILFQQETKVRCLRDGRVIFATLEVQLPCTSKDMPQRSGLFAVDPERQPVVTRLIPRQAEAVLPDAVPFFELSPDERHVCVPGLDGRVAVLTLATGEVWTLHSDEEADELRTVPTWRSADELCFSFGPQPGEPDGRAEIVLGKLDWEKRQVERKAISRDWPESVVDGFLVKKKEPQDTQPSGGG